MANLILTSVLSHPFGENTYIIHQEGSRQCVVVDPGLEPNKIFDAIESENLEPVVILLTHGHSDHIGGNHAMKQRWPELPIVIGTLDEPKLSDPDLNLSGAFGVALTSPPADQLVNEGDKIQYAGIAFHVLETPGHSIGHVVFVVKTDAGPWHLIGGDVLFQGSIGRTDFPDGSFEQLESAIHKKLFTMPGNTIVYPGHGPTTTIQSEIEANPFVGKPAGYLC
ncbi:MAG: MBL fold metallo-hydrolase [Pirellulales bacterium]